MSDYKKGISVIVPISRGEKYIKRCINSLLSQTFRKYMEYIFVIDKNTNPETEIIIKNMTKNISNVKIIKPAKSSGQGYNRNVGIEQVTKEYFGFSDDDDYCDSDFFERLYDYAKIYNADIVMGETTILNDDTNNLINKISFPLKIEYTLGKAFSFIPWCSSWDKIYRTKTFKNDKTVRFQENICCFEDNIFILNALYKSNKIVATCGSSYYWMRHSQTAQLNSEYNDKRIEDAYTAMNAVLDSVEKFDLPVSDKIILCKRFQELISNVITDNTKIDYIQNRIKQITKSI